MRILIVEDDHSTAALLQTGLQNAGYTAVIATDGLSGLEQARNQTFQLIILDVMLPGIGGIELCRMLRAERITVPILMLTALGTVDDRVRGLDAGADDYMVKPFDVDELLARLRVLERRHRGAVENRVGHGELEIDTAGMSVRLRGQPVALQRREFLLLRKLLDNTGQVMTRQQLEESIYGWEGDIESNALEVHVHNLRRKLYPSLIRTVRGVGYVVDPPAADAGT